MVIDINEKKEPVEIEHRFFVRESKKSGQKTIGIPSMCNLKTGDEVSVMKIVKDNK